MFSNVNCIPGENQPQFEGLPVMSEMIDGVPYMSSLWKPSPEELAVLNKGGRVQLTLQVLQHPPVAITVVD